MKRLLIAAVTFLLLCGCLGYPATVKPVNGFELEKFLGRWYEIARFDHSFERGLEAVTAEYSAREDGGVRVQNRGFSVETNEWKESIGKAYFVENENIGYLRVSFFGPFYGSYVIFELDKQDYQYAFVTSSKQSYVWFLSRSPTVSKELKSHFKAVLREKGFDPNKLIWVNQK
ncbi:lipocalin family protein [Desulfatitalea tepidiphila]|uniref:lipocalin family protein n=1 Tax=Desulfatitalea tepidiphila TaxID=1185843 RepID=UPI0006B4EFB2|nr:lipocalin family protein [Desulfatitalea tepidiphila]